MVRHPQYPLKSVQGWWFSFIATHVFVLSCDHDLSLECLLVTSLRICHHIGNTCCQQHVNLRQQASVSHTIARKFYNLCQKHLAMRVNRNNSQGNVIQQSVETQGFRFMNVSTA
jgi:hypothetical protein